MCQVFLFQVNGGQAFVLVLCPGQEIFVEIQSRTMRLGSVVVFVAYGAADGAFPDVVDVEC